MNCVVCRHPAAPRSRYCARCRPLILRTHGPGVKSRALRQAYDPRLDAFRCQRSGAESRDVAAWLARKWTAATLRQLAEPLGLTHPDSVNNLVRRAERAVRGSAQVRAEIDAIESTFRRTENRG